MPDKAVLLKKDTPQQRAVAGLADSLRKKYVSKENMYLLLLTGTEEQIQCLRLSDILYRSIQNSIRFNQCRRAVRCLGLYELLCSRIFNAERMAEARNMLNNKLFKHLE